MLSWASYLFGSGQSSEPQQDEAVPQSDAMETEDNNPGDQEWVVVEHSDCAFRRTNPTARPSHVTCYPGNRTNGNKSDVGRQCHEFMMELGTQFSPSKSDSSCDSSPSKLSTPSSLSPASQTRYLYVHVNHGPSLSEGWLLTPPPRFTTGNDNSPRVGITDLENLLIEHPSMSVYKRSGSEGEESNISESSNNELISAKSKRSQAASRQAPKRAGAVSARAEVLAQVSQVKHAQKLQQKLSGKKHGKKNLERANKTAVKDKRTSQKNKVRNPSGRMSSRIPQRKQ